MGTLRRGVQCDVGRLNSRGLDDQFAEHRVDPLEHIRVGPEVRGQFSARLVPEERGELHECGDVCTPEPVDRLLRVTHDEDGTLRSRAVAPVLSAPIRARRDTDRQFDLDRVGVLELVEQQVLVLLLQLDADLLIGTQHLTRKHQQVVEEQQPFPPTLVGGREDLTAEEHQ